MNNLKEFRKKALSFQLLPRSTLFSSSGKNVPSRVEDEDAYGLRPERLHQRIRMYVTPASFILTALLETPEQVRKRGGDLFREEVIQISFADGSISRKDVFDLGEDGGVVRQYEVFGIVGMMSLYSGVHLVVITSRTCVGSILGKEVYCVEKVAVLPLDANRASEILDNMVCYNMV